MTTSEIVVAIGGADIVIRDPTAIVGIAGDTVVCVGGSSPTRGFTYRQAALHDRDGRLVLMGHTWGHIRSTRFRGKSLTGHEAIIVTAGDTFELGNKQDHSIAIRSHRPIISARFEDDEAGFLAAIRADPDDAPTREVYADALEQRGHDLRAAWLRKELELRRDPGEPVLRDQLEALTRALAGAPRWRMVVARARIETSAILAARTEQGMRDWSWPPPGTTFPLVDREPCAELTCPREWNALAPRPDEHERMIHPYRGLERECSRCRESVHLLQSLEALEREASYSGEAVIAIDRVTAPRKRYDG